MGSNKKCFLFEAPWNICFTPKIIDPFTGHEAKGDLPPEFKEYFIRYAQKKYKKYINDYNSIIESYDIDTSLREFCRINSIDDERFVSDALKELSTINFI